MSDKTSNADTTSNALSSPTGAESAPVANKTAKIRIKRLSKSERTHRRRLKQAARKLGAAGG